MALQRMRGLGLVVRYLCLSLFSSVAYALLSGACLGAMFLWLSWVRASPDVSAHSLHAVDIYVLAILAWSSVLHAAAGMLAYAWLDLLGCFAAAAGVALRMTSPSGAHHPHVWLDVLAVAHAALLSACLETCLLLRASHTSRLLSRFLQVHHVLAAVVAEVRSGSRVQQAMLMSTRMQGQEAAVADALPIVGKDAQRVSIVHPLQRQRVPADHGAQADSLAWDLQRHDERVDGQRPRPTAHLSPSTSSRASNGDVLGLAQPLSTDASVLSSAVPSNASAGHSALGLRDDAPLVSGVTPIVQTPTDDDDIDDGGVSGLNTPFGVSQRTVHSRRWQAPHQPQASSSGIQVAGGPLLARAERPARDSEQTASLKLDVTQLPPSAPSLQQASSSARAVPPAATTPPPAAAAPAPTIPAVLHDTIQAMERCFVFACLALPALIHILVDEGVLSLPASLLLYCGTLFGCLVLTMWHSLHVRMRTYLLLPIRRLTLFIDMLANSGVSATRRASISGSSAAGTSPSGTPRGGMTASGWNPDEGDPSSWFAPDRMQTMWLCRVCPCCCKRAAKVEPEALADMAPFSARRASVTGFRAGGNAQASGRTSRQSVAGASSTPSSTHAPALVHSTMEVDVLRRYMRRMWRLVQLGFGEAGHSIIARYLRRAGLGVSQLVAASGMGVFSDAALDMLQTGSSTRVGLTGEKVHAVFMFCDIRTFTDITECLQEGVLAFVNDIAQIVHTETGASGGAPNKNIGDAFLLAWKLPDAPLENTLQLRQLQRVLSLQPGVARTPVSLTPLSKPPAPVDDVHGGDDALGATPLASSTRGRARFSSWMVRSSRAIDVFMSPQSSRTPRHTFQTLGVKGRRRSAEENNSPAPQRRRSASMESREAGLPTPLMLAMAHPTPAVMTDRRGAAAHVSPLPAATNTSGSFVSVVGTDDVDGEGKGGAALLHGMSHLTLSATSDLDPATYRSDAAKAATSKLSAFSGSGQGVAVLEQRSLLQAPPVDPRGPARGSALPFERGKTTLPLLLCPISSNSGSSAHDHSSGSARPAEVHSLSSDGRAHAPGAPAAAGPHASLSFSSARTVSVNSPPAVGEVQPALPLRPPQVSGSSIGDVSQPSPALSVSPPRPLHTAPVAMADQPATVTARRFSLHLRAVAESAPASEGVSSPCLSPAMTVLDSSAPMTPMQLSPLPAHSPIANDSTPPMVQLEAGVGAGAATSASPKHTSLVRLQPLRIDVSRSHIEARRGSVNLHTPNILAGHTTPSLLNSMTQAQSPTTVDAAERDAQRTGSSVNTTHRAAFDITERARSTVPGLMGLRRASMRVITASQHQDVNPYRQRYGVQVVATNSLAAAVNIVVKIAASNRPGGRLHQYKRRYPRLRTLGLADFCLGFGLHIGYAIGTGAPRMFGLLRDSCARDRALLACCLCASAVAAEGPIGSHLKIDASYLSPAVNITARLESATRYYGVDIIVSQKVCALLYACSDHGVQAPLCCVAVEAILLATCARAPELQFAECLSEQAQQLLRLIDRVKLKGVSEPMALFTFDWDADASTRTLGSHELPSTATPRTNSRTVSSAAGVEDKLPARGAVSDGVGMDVGASTGVRAAGPTLPTRAPTVRISLPPIAGINGSPRSAAPRSTVLSGSRLADTMQPLTSRAPLTNYAPSTNAAADALTSSAAMHTAVHIPSEAEVDLMTARTAGTTGEHEHARSLMLRSSSRDDESIMQRDFSSVPPQEGVRNAAPRPDAAGVGGLYARRDALTAVIPAVRYASFVDVMSPVASPGAATSLASIAEQTNPMVSMSGGDNTTASIDFISLSDVCSDLAALQPPSIFSDDFFHHSDEAVLHYLGDPHADWPRARFHCLEALRVRPSDGPMLALLAFINERGVGASKTAPASWQGYRIFDSK